MNINTYRQNENDVTEYRNAIKYWSNSIGELHYHGKYDISEAELPNELHRVYCDFDIFGKYSSRCYLVETEKGYGIALVNEYDECFADDCHISMTELFDSLLEDTKDISLLSCFSKAEIYIGEHMGFDESHELAVIFPADISREEFEQAAKTLDNYAYYHANLLAHANPEVDTPYLFTVTETYKRTVVVYAKDQIEAEQRIEDLCNGGKIDLDFEDFNDRSTECRGVASKSQIKLFEVFDSPDKENNIKKPGLDKVISSANKKVFSVNESQNKETGHNR